MTNIPINSKNGKPYAVGDVLDNYDEAKPVVLAWAEYPHCQVINWFSWGSTVVCTGSTVYDYMFPITLTKLPPQWKEAKPKPLNLNLTSSFRQILEAIKPHQKLLLEYGTGEDADEMFRSDGATDFWIADDIRQIWTALQLGGTVEVLQ